jgi:hypothetical protein
MEFLVGFRFCLFITQAWWIYLKLTICVLHNIILYIWFLTLIRLTCFFFTKIMKHKFCEKIMEVNEIKSSNDWDWILESMWKMGWNSKFSWKVVKITVGKFIMSCAGKRELSKLFHFHFSCEHFLELLKYTKYAKI